MKQIFLNLLIFILIVFSSCKKDPISNTPLPTPEPIVKMEYTNLNHRAIKYQQSGTALDVNNDSRPDLFFGVQLIGDPIYKVDKRQYFVISSITTAVAVNLNEQINPLNKSQIIPLNNFDGNNWYNASEIILMERNDFASGTILWRGNWVDKGKKYLPFQVFKNNQRFNGWIELTADKAGEQLVLHQMAISKEAEKEVRAGE